MALVAAIIFSPSNVLRIILGIPFMLFFPGYTLMAALFPKNEPVGGIERVALSFGTSIAVVALIGLILNYTPWGIRLESILCSLVSLILILSIIAWVRRYRLLDQERFSVEFQLGLPGGGMGAWDKVLSAILVLAILGALGMMGYAIAKPKVGERFTEFGILGAEGKLENYPSELMVGEEGQVIVYIANHEHETVTYRVEVRIGEVKNNDVGPIVLEHGGEWEEEVSFVAEVAGDNQKVEFLLYKNREVEPCLEPLRLLINVIG